MNDGATGGESVLVLHEGGFGYGKEIAGVEIGIPKVLPKTAVELIASSACYSHHDSAGVASVLGAVIAGHDSEFLERIGRREVQRGVLGEVLIGSAVQPEFVLGVAAPGDGDGGAGAALRHDRRGRDADHAGHNQSQRHGVAAIQRQLLDACAIQ